MGRYESNVKLAEVLGLSQNVSRDRIPEHRNERPAASQIPGRRETFQPQVGFIASNVPSQATGIPSHGNRTDFVNPIGAAENLFPVTVLFLFKSSISGDMNYRLRIIRFRSGRPITDGS